MQDSTFVLISVCAMGLICLALIGGGLFLVLRLTGHTLRELLGGQGISEAIDSAAGIEKASIRRVQTQRLPQTSNLRAQAQSLDFDAAVAKFKNNPDLSASPLNAPTQSSPTPTPQLDPAPPPSPAQRRRRIRRETEEIDDMLGGFMDEGGDDILPF